MSEQLRLREWQQLVLALRLAAHELVRLCIQDELLLDALLLRHRDRRAQGCHVAIRGRRGARAGKALLGKVLARLLALHDRVLVRLLCLGELLRVGGGRLSRHERLLEHQQHWRHLRERAHSEIEQLGRVDALDGHLHRVRRLRLRQLHSRRLEQRLQIRLHLGDVGVRLGPRRRRGRLALRLLRLLSFELVGILCHLRFVVLLAQRLQHGLVHPECQRRVERLFHLVGRHRHRLRLDENLHPLLYLQPLERVVRAARRLGGSNRPLELGHVDVPCPALRQIAQRLNALRQLQLERDDRAQLLARVGELLLIQACIHAGIERRLHHRPVARQLRRRCHHRRERLPRLLSD